MAPQKSLCLVNLFPKFSQWNKTQIKNGLGKMAFDPDVTYYGL